MLNSLRTRLILIFLVLVFIPLAAISIFNFVSGFNVLIDQSTIIQREISQRAAASLSAYFGEREAELFTLTQVYGFDELSSDAQRTVLLTLLSKQSAYYQVSVADAAGQETLRVTRGEVVTTRNLRDLSADPTVQVALETRNPSFSEVYFNEAARDRLISLVMPVEDLLTGQIGYLLVADIRFQTISDEVLRVLNLSEGTEAFITDDAGTILAHRNPNFVLRGTVFNAPSEDGRAAGLNVEEAIIASTALPLANQTLRVVTQTDYEVVIAPARARLATTLGVVAVILIISTLIIAYASNRLARPILQIARAAAAVEKGDLSVRTNVPGKDEIASLSQSFNAMTSQLQERLNALRDNEARLSAVVRALPDLVVTMGTDGRLIEFYGGSIVPPEFEASQFVNQTAMDLVPPENAGVMLEKSREAIRTGQVQVYEFTIDLPFGKQSFEARYSRLNDNAVVIVSRDISEQKRRAEEREQLIRDLQAAKRLAEENSRLKSEFLSTMSHELRTPLNAIEGFTSVVLRRMGGAEFNQKTEDYLTRVHSNSRRLLSLINDFLDLSRVEAGRLELASQPFDPAQLARRWQSEIGVLAEKKGLTFDCQIAPDLPTPMYGDEEAISKVAINLLSNAIKFTEQGGVSLHISHTPTEWEITVSDTGIGIPPHAREFVFEEFRQVDQSSRRKYGGTGLGLAIVQKYTRSMGGSVSLKSEVGQGSTFVVTLPLKTTA
jgi:signal transduction histidine kinase